MRDACSAAVCCPESGLQGKDTPPRNTIPFLRPTILTASVIAFLQSFENYNTTIFSIGGSHTLVTEIGSRMRFGLTPAVNVIGIIFVVITLVCAAAYVIIRGREAAWAGAVKR